MSEMLRGKYYRVPAVRVETWKGFSGWLPVIGPKHDDREIINFPWPHFHIDWRFAPERVYREAAFRMPSRYKGPDNALEFGQPIQCPDTRQRQVILEGPTLKLMKYKRELRPFPVALAKWMPKLEAAFACTAIVNGKCPHRGIPVDAMIRDGDTLTCPGHGLRFNATTGKLLPRFNQENNDVHR